MTYIDLPIRAAVASDVHARLTIETLYLRGDLGPTDILIENKAAGLCHSDLNVLEGKSPRKFPIILGHEGAGVVLACGSDVVSLKPGDRVVTCGVGECGHCDRCRSRKTNLCLNSDFAGLMAGFPPSPFLKYANGDITVLAPGASFASHAVVPEIYATRVPDSIPFEVACLFGCAIITGVGAAIFTAEVETGSSAVVFGLGGVGLNVIDGAALAGATTIIGVDVNVEKEAIARKFGLTHFINPGATPDVPAAIRDLTGGGADYAFDCVGNPALVGQAVQSTRPEWGKIVCIGAGPRSQGLPTSIPELLLGRTITGSLFGKGKTRTDMSQMLGWFTEGRLHSDLLVSHILPLDEINEGFALMHEGQTVRAVVTF